MFDAIPINSNRTVGAHLFGVIGVAALALFYQGEAFAQATPVKPGDRVRVTAPSLTGEPIVGVVVSLDGDVLSVGDEEGRASRQLPLEAVTRLERSVYRASQAGTDNQVTENGSSPPPLPIPLPGVDLLWDGSGADNCWSGNTFDTSVPSPLPPCS